MLSTLSDRPLLYRLTNDHNPECALRVRIQGGSIALLAFTSREKAERFIEGKRLSGRLASSGMSHREIIQWLLNALEAGDTDYVAFDSDAEELNSSIPDRLSSVLARYEAEQPA